MSDAIEHYQKTREAFAAAVARAEQVALLISDAGSKMGADWRTVFVSNSIDFPPGIVANRDFCIDAQTVRTTFPIFRRPLDGSVDYLENVRSPIEHDRTEARTLPYNQRRAVSCEGDKTQLSFAVP